MEEGLDSIIIQSVRPGKLEEIINICKDKKIIQGDLLSLELWLENKVKFGLESET